MLAAAKQRMRAVATQNHARRVFSVRPVIARVAAIITQTARSATLKFWLLQTLGWLPYAMLQLLISSDDRPLAASEQVFPALTLVFLAVCASLLLRALYRRLQTANIGELRWLQS